MLKILMVASEAAPFAKTGGLADVVGSLPSALLKQGADVRVILPKYGTIPLKLRESIVHSCSIYVKMGWRNLYCGIEQIEYNGVTYYFIDNEFYFNRDSLYSYGDDGERFAFFNRAVLEVIPYLDFTPDILHCHDWQAGMVPVLLEAEYRNIEQYQGISTVFTIHNLRYQGIYHIDEMKEWFSLSDDYFTADKLEFFNCASFMKGGLTYSKVLTTVSNTYAEEIKYPFYGERMDGLLNARSEELFGIINGIDYEEFNPQKDSLIYQTYTKSKINDKDANKLALQKELGLTEDEKVPMIGLISRLVDQKGLDLIACVFDEIIVEDIQLVILGTGDAKYEYLFKEAMNRYPGKVSANIRFDNTLAHKIYAAADLFLMPSLFEPCGLGQLISLRYGTLPIVRETGGLKDTVLSYNEVTEEGNGFSFSNYNAHDMLHTIRRAAAICRKKTLRNKLRKAAMSCDYSWQNSAAKYMELYKNLGQE
ncbi:MAG TPA: glycogen synthase GlgA [Mobilitalea sp.]|nr:glycogen synthase GlgA [Mobilitalea sp.]